MRVASRQWLVTTVFCLIGFALGYAVRSRTEAPSHQPLLKVNKMWGRTARAIWPGLSDWSDEQIEVMLKKPVGFRSAFDECREKDDDQIARIAEGAVPANAHNFISACLPPDDNGVKYQICKPSGECSDANKARSEIDQATGERIPQRFTKAEMMNAERIAKELGSVPSNWTK